MWKLILNVETKNQTFLILFGISYDRMKLITGAMALLHYTHSIFYFILAWQSYYYLCTIHLSERYAIDILK